MGRRNTYRKTAVCVCERERERKRHIQGLECSARHVRRENVGQVGMLRAALKTTGKNAVWEESSATASGVLTNEFDFGSHEWSCSPQTLAMTGRKVVASR